MSFSFRAGAYPGPNIYVWASGPVQDRRGFIGSDGVRVAYGQLVYVFKMQTPETSYKSRDMCPVLLASMADAFWLFCHELRRVSIGAYNGQQFILEPENEMGRLELRGPMYMYDPGHRPRLDVGTMRSFSLQVYRHLGPEVPALGRRRLKMKRRLAGVEVKQ